MLQPLYAKIGYIDYREIYLSDRGEICPPPKSNNADSNLTPDAWVVRGRIVDEAGQPLSGLTVSLYDEDLIFDDVLDTSLTDDKGNFRFIYRAKAVPYLIEADPEIHLKIFDKEGKTLYKSSKTVRFKAARVEFFDIIISQKPD